MTDAEKELVKATLPALREHGETITQVFYRNLLTTHTELQPMFATGDQENGQQARRLAQAVLAYAANITQLNLLGPAVTRIARRHVALSVQPEHYPIVGKHLLGAIQQVLGPAATPEILSAWSAAYTELAKIMIGLESNMYAGA